MKAVRNFIVKPSGGHRYNNSIKIAGCDFFVNTSEEEHLYSNREAEVIEVPVGYKGEIQKGDILLVHHNIFKTQFNVKGKRQYSFQHIDKDLFFVDEESLYAYKRNGKWKSVGKFCLVKPIVSDLNRNEELSLIGEMAYPNDYLTKQGVKSGDKIVFSPDSEYEFQVEGQKMYRMYEDSITAIL